MFETRKKYHYFSVHLFLVLVVAAVSIASVNAAEMLITNPPAPFAESKTEDIATFKPVLKEVSAVGRSIKSKASREVYFFCGDSRIGYAAGEIGGAEGSKKKIPVLFCDINSRFKGMIYYWPGIAVGNRRMEENALRTELNADESQNCLTFERDFYMDESKSPVTFRQQVKSIDDELIELSYAVSGGLSSGDESVTMQLGLADLMSEFAGKSILLDGAKVNLPDEDYVMKGEKEQLFNGVVSEIVFFPEAPGKTFRILLPDQNKTTISLLADKTKVYPQAIAITFYTREHDVRLQFDLTRAPVIDPEAVADQFHGVRFWETNRLVVPDYRKCRNLIQNPSFEAGLRYFDFQTSWAEFRYRSQQPFTISEDGGKYGKRCLEMNVCQGDNSIGFLRTFTMPIQKGKHYALSFYAKADRENLALRFHGVDASKAKWPGQKTLNDQYHAGPILDVTSGWQRYTIQMESTTNAFSFGLWPLYLGNENQGEIGKILVDAMQLEEGDEATEFIEKPLCAILATTDADNFISKDESLNPVLEIHTLSSIAGQVTGELENYFGEMIWKGSFDFSTDESGVASVKLPFDSEVGQGVFVLKALFEMDNGFADTDFFRFEILEKIKKRHLHSDVFSSHHPGLGIARGDDLAKRLQESGIGLIEANEYYKNQQSMYELCAKYGLTRDSMMLHMIINNALANDERFKDLSNNDGRFWTFLRDLKEVTPEFEVAVEQVAFEAAKSMPWCTYFDMSREMEGIRMMIRGQDDDMGRLLQAVRRGVKRGNPNCKFRAGDTSNLSKLNFTKRYFNMFQKTVPEIKFDTISSNHYRHFPEKPDFNEDIENLIKVMGENGYENTDIHLLEGMYWHSPQGNYAPQWGFHLDDWRRAVPSYDMSWQERIYAAYNAREWIVGLKYASRVKRICSWADYQMDYYLTPTAREKIPNTLVNLLGDSIFYGDLRFAPNTRCYVFNDGGGRLVAAVWSHIDAVDTGKRQSPVFQFNFKQVAVELYDLMGNQRTFQTGDDGLSQIPLTPFPVFLRCPENNAEPFMQALQNAFTNDDLGQLEVTLSSRLVDSANMEFAFQNLVCRESDVEFIVNRGTDSDRKTLHLRALEEKKINIPLAVSVSADRIVDIRLPITLIVNGKTIRSVVSFRAFSINKASNALTLDSDAAAWANIPVMPIINKKLSDEFFSKKTKSQKEGYAGDYSASFQMAWDEKNLYLRVMVEDDIFSDKENKTRCVGSTGSPRWMNDCMQLYMDTLGNAKRSGNPIAKYDDDDLNFNFYPNSDGTIDIIRGQMPDIQLQGGVACAHRAGTWVAPEMMPSKFAKTPTGYIFTVIIPAESNLRPFEIRPGAVCGFSLLMVDNDDDLYRKTMRTLTPPNTEGHRNPHLYPVMILNDQ